jgi:hypothetical protein
MMECTLYKTLKDKVDRRLPVFDCFKRVIAFDGAALLLNELWQRKLAGEEERKKSKWECSIRL